MRRGGDDGGPRRSRRDGRRDERRALSSARAGCEGTEGGDDAAYESELRPEARNARVHGGDGASRWVEAAVLSIVFTMRDPCRIPGLEIRLVDRLVWTCIPDNRVTIAPKLPTPRVSPD